jgi:Sigma-70, region 4
VSGGRGALAHAAALAPRVAVAAAAETALVPPELTPSGVHVRLRRYLALAECTDDGPPGADCLNTGCRYHLAHRGYWEHHLKPTRDCAIDVANEGPHTLDEVAAVLGVSGERARQIEEQALEHLKHNETVRRLRDDLSE